MRFFLGMITGALLLGLGAYFHDSMATSTVASGSAAPIEQRTFVNWNVVGEGWQSLKSQAQAGWVKLSAQVNRG